MKNYNIAGYIRLSKEDEKEGESGSIINQKELIKKFLKTNEMGGCKFFVDDGYSGSNFERPGFKKMIKEIEDGNINIVITKDTSRLGRDFIETSRYMFKYFPEHKVRYIAVLENFDTFKPNGVEDMIPFQTIINDWYLKDTSKKIKSVRQNKMRQGLYMGSTVAYGYKRAKENNCKFEIDKYASLIVKKIFKMKLEGLTSTMIARKLTEEKILPPAIYNNKNIEKTYTTYMWGISTINQILKNQIYIGNLVQRKFDKINYKSKKKIKLNENEWIITENFVKPIIRNDEFTKVQEMMENNIGNCQKKYKYFLKGLVICGDCGKTMTVRRREVKRKNKENYIETYYCCSNNIRFRNGVCSLHYFNETKLNNLIIECLRNILNKYANIQKMQSLVEKKIKNSNKNEELSKEKKLYQNKVNTINKALKSIYIDKANSIITEEDFLQLIKELNEEKDKYIEEVKDIEKKMKKKQKEPKSTYIENIIKDFLEVQSFSKNILTEFIKKIEIMENKKIKVYFKFYI